MNKRCTVCGKSFPVDEMFVKRVQFHAGERPYRVLRSRTIARICRKCRDEDPAWRQKPHVEAAGYR